jgi:exonuclease III
MFNFRVVAALALTLSAAPILSLAASPLTITTWNLEHMMSEAVFDEWASFCAKYGWDEDKVKAAGAVKPKHLTYCNAHNGLLYPTSIQESRPLQTKAAFDEKVEALVKRRAELNSEVFALQEVSDEAAVRRIFPASEWEAISSKAEIAQNIAFVVRKNAGIRVVSSRQVDELAQKDDAGHLKASCRAQPLSEPTRPGYADDKRWSEIQQGCKVMRKQAPALENWVEAQTRAKQQFMILGDWNRDLKRDLALPARLNSGELAKSPIDANTRIGSLLKEISDNEPQGAWLAVVFPSIKARTKTLKAPDQKKPDQVCHQGIDNFALSDSLMKSLAVAKDSLQALGIDYGEQAYALNKARPSDHCPVTLSLNW